MLQNDFIFKEVLATLAMENLTLTQAEQELVQAFIEGKACMANIAACLACAAKRAA